MRDAPPTSRFTLVRLVHLVAGFAPALAGLATGAPAAAAASAPVAPVALAHLAAAAPAIPAPVSATRPSLPFHIVDQFQVGGDGPWGDLAYDRATHRLFAPRATVVQVVDADARRAAGEIPCPDGPHGLALAEDLRRGFLTSVSDTTLLVFDLDSLRVLKTLKIAPPTVGELTYDAGTKRVFMVDPSGTITAFDARTGEAVASRSLSERPLDAVADGAGALYLALPEQDAIAVLDAHTLLDRARWTLDSGARPAALAYDPATRRLFAAGRGLWLSALETDRGRTVARVAVGGGVQGLVFDPARRLIVSIGNGGASSTVWQESADRYTMVATTGTHSGARAIALDPDHQVAYVAAAEVVRSAHVPKPGERPEPRVVPNSFTVFVLRP